jgi:hypothetical protein
MNENNYCSEQRSQDPFDKTNTSSSDMAALQYGSDNDGSTPSEVSETTTTTTRSSSFQNLTLAELSGACGDFGTLIPLLVAMARGRTIYLAPTLFLSGIVHIATGCYWDIPMPLQPMKAIASLAIAQDLTRAQVTAAGVGMGVCFLLLSVNNMIEILNKWIPSSVIGGLQLGVGWKLALKGIKMIQGLPWWFNASIDCISLSILCGLLCLYGLKRRPYPTRQARPTADTSGDAVDGQNLHGDESQMSSVCHQLFIQPPVGILLFFLGVILATVKLAHEESATEVDDSEPLLVNALKNITTTDWRIGILSGTLTQLPLTTLNSCLSVCLLAHTLFPYHKSQRVSRRSVCISIGLINFLMCPLGMMPTCHGAGGLAGQHRLGANSGVSMVVLGLFKITLGLIASQGLLLRVLDALPVSILAMLVVLAGHELAVTGVIKVAKSSLCQSNDRDTAIRSNTTNGEDAMVVCLVTALVIVGTGYTHIGTLCGWFTCAIYGGGDIPFRSCFCSCRSSERNDNNSSRVEYAEIPLRSDP